MCREALIMDFNSLNAGSLFPGLFRDAIVHVQCYESSSDDENINMVNFKTTLDCLEEIASLEGHCCLEIMSDPENPRSSTGLLLRPTGTRPMTFTRVGHYTPPYPRDLTTVGSWARRVRVDII